MDDDIVIKVENVSKKYCKSLKRSMFYGVSDIGCNAIRMKSNCDKLRTQEFWAVDNLSFEIHKGEAFGIIGHNGSGKSTTLKMLNGIFMPDKGKITIKGRVGALIEVGAGFHPMLTGRENIYINGSILGMTREEVDQKFDDIVAFADIGDFLDSPVKYYSSGMYVKLGFSIAVHSDPDILLIDEILAVGDLKFQKRCLDRLSEMCNNGVTTILVSHHMPKIGSFCDRVLLLSNGKKEILDKAHVAIEKFEEMMCEDVVPSIGSVPSSNPIGGAILDHVAFESKNENEIYLKYRDPINISLNYDLLDKDIDDCCIAIIAYRKSDGLRCFGILSSDYDIPIKHKKGRINLQINNHSLLPNDYVIDVQVRSKMFDKPYVTHREKNVVIGYPDYYVLKNLAGVYQPKDVDWEFQNNEE